MLSSAFDNGLNVSLDEIPLGVSLMTIFNVLSGIIREGAFFTGDPHRIRTQTVNRNRLTFSGQFYKQELQDTLPFANLVLKFLPQVSIFTRDEGAQFSFTVKLDGLQVFSWSGSFFAFSNPDQDVYNNYDPNTGFQQFSAPVPQESFEFRVEFTLTCDFMFHEGAGDNFAQILFEIYGETTEAATCDCCCCGA